MLERLTGSADTSSQLRDATISNAPRFLDFEEDLNVYRCANFGLHNGGCRSCNSVQAAAATTWETELKGVRT